MAPRDSEAAYTRALAFGGAVAVVAFFLFSVGEIATGFMFGYLSFALGWAIAKMMMIGSKGIGGRRYQWTALILTYATVSMSAVPIAIAYQDRMNAAVRAQAKAVNLAEEQRKLEEEFGSDGSRPLSSAAQDAKKDPAQKNGKNPGFETTPRIPARPVVGTGAAFGTLVIIGLFSPLLALATPIQGGVLLILLILGMVLAWRTTAARRMEITGPFRT